MPPISLMIKVPLFPISLDLHMHLSACYFRISSPAPNPQIPASSPWKSPSPWCQPITAVYGISLPPITPTVGKKNMMWASVVRKSGWGTWYRSDHLKVVYWEPEDRMCMNWSRQRHKSEWVFMSIRVLKEFHDYKCELLEMELFLMRLAMKLIWKVKMEISGNTASLMD